MRYKRTGLDAIGARNKNTTSKQTSTRDWSVDRPNRSRRVTWTWRSDSLLRSVVR